MKRLAAFMLLSILSLILAGCTGALHVEDQAYIIALGLDQTEDGALILSVRIPHFAGSGGSAEGGESSGAPKNLFVSISAPGYEKAIDLLEQRIPRGITMTQLELIVLSEALSRSEACADLLQRLMNSSQICTTASVVVCPGSAKDFIEALKPEMGVLLSSDISASIEHYRDMGMLPDCSLASLHSLTHSVYSDPVAAYALLSHDAPSHGENAGEKPRPSVRYGGAAVFRDGKCRLILNSREAILLSLIHGSLESFRYICGGEALEFSPIGDCSVQVNLSRSPAQIELSLRLSVASRENMPEDAVMEETLRRDMLEIINQARSSGVEPFGFAEAAAPQFLTLKNWINFDWQDCYENAEIIVKLRFSHADA